MTENYGDLVKLYNDDKIKHIVPQEGLFVWSKDTIALSAQTTIENNETMIETIIREIKLKYD